MRLLTAIILENEGFSLNDMTSIQRMALKKAYTGRLDHDNISDKAMEVLDTLVDFGLLDMGYGVTENGERAAKMLDKYSRREREDLGAAKQLAAAEVGHEMDDLKDRDPSRGRENFKFTEGEKAVMGAAGLDAETIAQLFEEGDECVCDDDDDDKEDKKDKEDKEDKEDKDDTKDKDDKDKDDKDDKDKDDDDDDDKEDDEDDK